MTNTVSISAVGQLFFNHINRTINYINCNAHLAEKASMVYCCRTWA